MSLINMKIKLFLTIVAFSVIGCSSNEPKSPPVYNVKYVLENLEHLHGKTINIRGAVHRSFEACVIVQIDETTSKPDPEYMIWFNEKNKGCYAGDIIDDKTIVNGVVNKFGLGDFYPTFKGSLDDAEIEWTSKKTIKYFPYLDSGQNKK
ncbi:MAG TPA: hypothetical protein PLO83_08425 [Gammaproteobacteria bacterium]|nr:hypothetical protein [Gammaproteobacteria bacterium]